MARRLGADVYIRPDDILNTKPNQLFCLTAAIMKIYVENIGFSEELIKQQNLFLDYEEKINEWQRQTNNEDEFGFIFAYLFLIRRKENKMKGKGKKIRDNLKNNQINYILKNLKIFIMKSFFLESNSIEFQYFMEHQKFRQTCTSIGRTFTKMVYQRLEDYKTIHK